MSSVSAFSSNFIRKSIPFPSPPLSPKKPISLFLIYKFTSVSPLKVIQNHHFHQTPPHISTGSGQWVTYNPTDPPPKNLPEILTPPDRTSKLGVPPEVPRTPKKPDFDPIPPEKPADPPPIMPGPNPEFPGPPTPSPPAPEVPQPPLPSPPSRDVPPEVNPSRAPDYMPPKPPEVGPPHPLDPVIPPQLSSCFGSFTF